MTFLWTAFLIGLLGSFHCVGMCGPIALALPIGKWAPAKRFFGNALYQLGRVITYSILGLLIGLLGNGIRLAGFQQYVSIFAGVLMLLMAFLPQFEQRLEKWTSETKFMNKIRTSIRNAFAKKSLFGLLGIGLLNGLLPCGLVYAAVFGSLAMSSMSESVLFMAFFGLGTIPAMGVVVFAAGSIGPIVRKRIRKAVPVFIGILGVLFILRGLGLGIPYISPSNDALEIVDDQAPESCH